MCAARKNTHEAQMGAGNATLKSTCGARRWQLPSTRCRAGERCGTRRRTRTVHNQPVGRTWQKIPEQYRDGWRLFKCPRHLFSTLSSGTASSGSPTVILIRGLKQHVASSTSPCLSAFHGGCWSWQPQPIALQNGYSAEGKSVHCVSSHAGLAWEAMEANLKEQTQAASASR